jgi:hypothetical protein
VEESSQDKRGISSTAIHSARFLYTAMVTSDMDALLSLAQLRKNVVTRASGNAEKDSTSLQNNLPGVKSRHRWSGSFEDSKG